MFQLQNDYLAIDVLDPPKDQQHLGARFCHGAYIWQVRDRQGRDLLSGPEYPSSQPRPFNGQGLPEVFRFDDKWEGLPTTSQGNEALIIGVGKGVSEESPISIADAKVHKAVNWDIASQSDAIEFRCEDAWQDWSYHLTRRVTLTGTSIRLDNHVRNEGSGLLPLHWYLHPFLPVNSRQTSLIVQPGACLPLTNAFHQDSGGHIHIGKDCETDLGEVAWLGFPPGECLQATFSHPHCAGVEIHCDYPASYVLFWANRNATSIEPYIVRRIQPGEALSWSTTYRFSIR